MSHNLKTELFELIKNDESVFEFFLEGSRDGLWYWDLENPENEWMNARFWEVLGYNPEKMPHKVSAWQGIINQDDLKIALENFHKHLADPNHPYDQEVRYTHKNGSTVWVRCRGVAIRNTKGKAIRMVGVHQDITHLKNVENELRQEHEIVKKNEELFRFLTENSSDIIRYQKPSGKFNYVSPNIELLTGYTSDEYIKFGSLENVVPDDHSKLMDAVEKFQNGTNTLSLEYRIYHKTGRVIWLESRIKAIYNDNNELVSLVSSSNDITGKKNTELKLIESETRYKQLVETAVDAIYLIDENAVVVDTNQKATQMLEKSKDEIIGQTVEVIDPNFPAEAFLEYWAPFPFDQQRTFETTHIDKRGVTIPIEISGKKFKVEDKVFYYGIARDISERIKSEKELIKQRDSLKIQMNEYQALNNDFQALNKKLKKRNKDLKVAFDKVEASEKKFRSYINIAPDGIFIADEKGNYLEANPAACSITGYSLDELLNKTIADLLQEEEVEKGLAHFRNVVENEFSEGELGYVTKNGENRFWSVKAVKLSETRFLGFVKDITEQKQAEKKILDSLNLLNSFINNFPDDAWVKDIEGHITVANQYVKDNTFGCEDVIGKTVYDFFPHDVADECWKSEKDVIASDKTICIEEQIPQIDGIHSKILTKFPLHNVNGEVVGLGAIAHDITKQKSYSQQLIKSERRYRELVDTLNSGVAIYQVINNGSAGSDYIIQDFNQFALEHEQSNRDNVIGKSLKDIRPTIDEYGLIKVFREVWETGESQFFPAKVYTDDKYANYYENRVFRLPSKEIVAIYDDVTERESARLKLADSEQKLKNIIENSTNLFFAHSADHQMTFISPQVKDFLGYEPDEMMTDWTKFITDSPINQKAIEYTKKAIETGMQQPTYEMEMLRKDGKKIIVEVREAPVLENGKVVSIVGSLADVTDRKEAEQQIIQQNEEYEALNEELQQTNTQLSSTIAREAAMNDRFDKAMEASSDGIFDWNLKTNEIYYSPRWKSLLGYDDNELPNDFSVWEKLTNEKDVKRSWKMLHDLIDKKIDRFDMEFKMKHKEGHWIDIHSRADLFLDDSGQANRVVGTHTDITKRKQAEYEIRVAKEKAEESDKLKSAFLANMSHEIRTPMNGILGFADLLKKPGLKSASHQKYISLIEESGKRMLNIINDIIDISKIEAGLMELSIKKTNVNEQIDYVHSFFKPEAEAKGLRISIFKPLSVNEAYIYTDSEKLYAILTNLIKNAIKYTHNGSIEFGYRLKKCKKNQVDDTHQFDSVIEFFVKDTGIGIPKDRQNAIFERFIQADIEDKMAHQGAGLGLTITKNYVEKLGGEIWVESVENKGSVFYFTVPYNIKPLEEVFTQIQPESSFKPNKIRALKVLIAEDDAISEMFMSEIIAPFCKEIIKAGNGIEAVDLCRQNPDIDLVLMDIRMPLMDGYEAVKSIREFNKKVVIIAQTAYGLTGDREASINAGCNDYISKPINKTVLHEMLIKYFSNKTQ